MKVASPIVTVVLVIE
ncbi:hypothetical protein LM596_05465 [Liquorilactobacillus mali]|nr:hypothetical protein LM596_05465 [Liquorilactobacillus mali]